MHEQAKLYLPIEKLSYSEISKVLLPSVQTEYRKVKAVAAYRSGMQSLKMFGRFWFRLRLRKNKSVPALFLLRKK